MILTCPECATSYFVEAGSIPPAGRMVKCTNCGSRWRALPNDDAPEPPVETQVEAQPKTLGASEQDDLEVVPAAPTKKGAREAKPARADKPKRRLGPVLGIAAALVLAVGLGAATMFRTQVAGVIPGSAAVFEAVGLPISELGLVLEGVASQPAFQSGRPVLAISGSVRNTREEAAAVPPIRFALVDPEGAEVAILTAEPAGESLPGGAVRHFAVALPDPPAGAHELVVAFDLSGGAPAHD